MKYYEDMRTKWGFNDGVATPWGVELYRQVYIEAINRVSKELGSKVEAFPYDRPGMHNFCLLLYRKIGEDADAKRWQEAAVDEPMEKAVLICLGLGLDGLIQVEPKLPEDWKAQLEDLIVNAEKLED